MKLNEPDYDDYQPVDFLDAGGSINTMTMFVDHIGMWR